MGRVSRPLVDARHLACRRREWATLSSYLLLCVEFCGLTAVRCYHHRDFFSMYTLTCTSSETSRAWLGGWWAVFTVLGFGLMALLVAPRQQQGGEGGEGGEDGFATQFTGFYRRPGLACLTAVLPCVQSAQITVHVRGDGASPRVKRSKALCLEVVAVEDSLHRSRFMLYCLGSCFLYMCCWCCCLPCLLQAFVRREFRRKHGMRGALWQDLLLHCCAPACSLIQEAQEMEARGAGAVVAGALPFGLQSPLVSEPVVTIQPIQPRTMTSMSAGEMEEALL